MLVIFSFGLVLLATILLVVGLLNDSLGLIYLSIASSVAAAVVLFVAFRAARPKPHAEGERPEPLPGSPVDADVTEERQPVGVAASTTVAPEGTAAIPAVAAADDDWLDDEEWDDEEVIDFPIADYDDLTVAEITPLLPQLYSDELDVVIERERAGRNRSTIIKRLEDLKVSGTEADAAEAEAIESEDLATPGDTAPVMAASGRGSATDDDEDDLFPIADYDDLSVRQIVPLLSQLEEDELADVRARESASSGRKTVLAEIDRLSSGAAAAAAPAPAPAAPTRTTRGTAPRPARTAAKAKQTTRTERFPIANYDDLGVRDIRPRLSSLGPRQLEQVLDRERSGAGRKSIIDELERLIAGTGASAAPAATASTARKTSSAPKKAAKKAASPARFPIANYEALGVREIRPRLAKLSDRQLEEVLERERSGAGRRSIIDEIEKRLQ